MYKINGTANINAIRAASEQGKRGICTFLMCYLLFRFLPSLCCGAVHVCFFGALHVLIYHSSLQQQQPGLSLLDGIKLHGSDFAIRLKKNFEKKKLYN
jgi:hypothetical protein